MTAHTLIYDEILNVVQAGLTNSVESVFVQPGQEVAWDNQCGQLSLRVVSAAPRYTRGGQYGCPEAYTLTLGVMLLRCVASLDNDGRAPSPETMSLDGFGMIQDMQEVATALQCWTPSERTGVQDFALSEFVPQGPQGGMAGGEWICQMRTSVGSWVA